MKKTALETERTCLNKTIYTRLLFTEHPAGPLARELEITLYSQSQYCKVISISNFFFLFRWGIGDGIFADSQSEWNLVRVHAPWATSSTVWKFVNAPCTACRASQGWTVLLTSQKTPTESESSLRQYCCVLQFSEEKVVRTRDDSLCLLADRWEREGDGELVL